MYYKIESQEKAQIEQLETADDCLHFLEYIEKGADHPVGVYITRNGGACLSCVLGASKTAFVWYPTGCDGTGTWSSHTNKPASQDLDFWLCGHHTQAPADSQIDRALLYVVVDEFLKKGTRSDSIQWLKD